MSINNYSIKHHYFHVYTKTRSADLTPGDIVTLRTSCGAVLL